VEADMPEMGAGGLFIGRRTARIDRNRWKRKTKIASRKKRFPIANSVAQRRD